MSAALTLCAIFAHPDDESFGVSGTLTKYATEGVRTALICVTRGEAGMSHGLASSPAALAGLRAAELACAAQAMGLSDLEVLDFPDGEGQRWDQAALTSRIEGVLRRVGADVLVTFDQCGVTYHPDHMAVNQAIKNLVAARGEELGVRRLYYQVVTCPQEASPEGPSLACVSLQEVDITVDTHDFERTKRAALGCHRTQASDTAQLLDLPEGTLVSEHYQLAWSADGWRPPAGTKDLLAGMAAIVRGAA